MIIEIRKAGFLNKGAELMLIAMMERLKVKYPQAVFTMEPTPYSGARPFKKIVEAGLLPKASLYRYGFDWGVFSNLLPRKVREMYGVVTDREVDVVLDAAGFSYSDQWGDRSAKELAALSERWRKQGTKVVLMPQAFGPFTAKSIQKLMRKAIENVDLVIARDKTSFTFLSELSEDQNKLLLYPDFTNLLSGAVPSCFDPDRHEVCLIPNYRMIDKVDRSSSVRYIPFMVRCVEQIRARGYKPFLLVHEGAQDMLLALEISQRSGGVPIISEQSPIGIKGILGASLATVGSRFHGLVSALSQGVPSLATSWSHKYQELFRDYSFPDGMVSLSESDTEHDRKLNLLLDTDSRRQIVTTLKERSAALKILSESMWEEVFSVIDSGKRKSRLQ